MRFSDLKKRILTLMDTEKRIQRFSKIIISEIWAKSVHESKCFYVHQKLELRCLFIAYVSKCFNKLL